MPDYTVKSVAPEPRQWEAKKGGAMLSYKILVEGLDAPTGQVELAQKKDTAAPTVGQVITGTIENTDYGPKLKKEYQAGGGGGGKFYKPRDPGEIRGMQRSHAQEMALRALAIKYPDGLPGEGLDLDALLIPLIDWFDRDVSHAIESLDKKVDRVAKTLSDGPQKPQEAAVGPDNGGTAKPTKEQITEAWGAYLDKAGEKASLERSDAKKKAELQMAALGITDASSMSDEAAVKLMEFLTNG